MPATLIAHASAEGQAFEGPRNFGRHHKFRSARSTRTMAFFSGPIHLMQQFSESRRNCSAFIVVPPRAISAVTSPTVAMGCESCGPFPDRKISRRRSLVLNARFRTFRRKEVRRVYSQVDGDCPKVDGSGDGVELPNMHSMRTARVVRCPCQLGHVCPQLSLPTPARKAKPSKGMEPSEDTTCSGSSDQSSSPSRDICCNIPVPQGEACRSTLAFRYLRSASSTVAIGAKLRTVPGRDTFTLQVNRS
jgi:hypothetical protein